MVLEGLPIKGPGSHIFSINALNIGHCQSFGQIPLSCWREKQKSIVSLGYLYTRKQGAEICVAALPREGVCTVWSPTDGAVGPSWAIRMMHASNVACFFLLFAPCFRV